MFVALQYHVVQSHDGIQLVPRAPQAALGLVWADIRDWDAEKWSDRPALARALVAHGATDLISDSIANEIGDSRHPDSGTIGQLRSLLNGSLSSDLDAPMFGSGDAADFGSADEDSLSIPFPRETRQPQWDEFFADSTEQNRSRTDLADRAQDANPDFHSGFSDDDEHGGAGGRRPFNNDRSIRDHVPAFSEPSTKRQFTEHDSYWQSAPRGRAISPSKADARVRETTILEDLLFSDEDSTESDRTVPDSGFDSVTRALDSRAARALDRAGNAFIESGEAFDDSYVRDRSRSGAFGRRGPSPAENNDLPHAVRALREGFDPFLD